MVLRIEPEGLVGALEGWHAGSRGWIGGSLMFFGMGCARWPSDG